jgi:pimeloyl-ACP methyl ester carboxylesterase
VLGLSFGSVLALALYDQHPDVVRSLVLASAYAGWAGSLPPEEVQRRLQQVSRELDLPPEQILATWLPTLLTPTASQDVVDLVTAMMRDFRPAGMRAALRALGPADLRSVLGRISVPTLLLYGDADRRSPVSVGEDLHARIPGSALVLIPGAPHLASLEQPDPFNRAVRAFAHVLARASDA